MTAAAGASNTQSSSVNIPEAEHPNIWVQLAAFDAAEMAGCGLSANSEVSNNNTLLAIVISALSIAFETASATKAGVALLPITMLVATFIKYL